MATRTKSSRTPVKVSSRAETKSAPRTHNGTAAERGPFEERGFRTKNSIPADVRRQACVLLNQRLSDCVDLETQCKQAHWNVKGPNFIGLHELFDQIHAAVDGYADLIAERIVQLGGVAEGTARIAAARSTLLDYPLRIASGDLHVAALSDALAEFGRVARIGIDEMDDLHDADSADVLTEISRGIDKWLWFVEAHQQAAPAEDGDGA
jgi:starvation-inducible DNA-binding protein